MQNGNTNEALKRVIGMAERHGRAFMSVTFDAERQEFVFVTIPPEFVRVSYEDNGDAKR